VNQRKKSNAIKQVRSLDGVLSSGQENIEDTFLKYYKDLFRSSRLEGVEDCLSGIACRVTNEMNVDLLKPCTLQEVSLALQFMGPFKASGPDGFPASFYQHNWAHIGEEVCLATNHFISLGHMDEDINTTNIVLIHKKAHPISMMDFKPISLCNVIYKIISKVLANRLKAVLPHIISANQSSFIPGRLISDNILVANETLHSMQTRHWGKTGYVALKLDMNKTYDRVEWVFLDSVMQRMGFAPKLRVLI